MKFKLFNFFKKEKSKKEKDRIKAAKRRKHRRKKGLCVQCGSKVKETHVREGVAVIYSKCKRCRTLDKKRLNLKKNNEK